MAKEFIKATGTDDKDAKELFTFIAEKIIGIRYAEAKKELDIPVTSTVIIMEDVVTLCKKRGIEMELKIIYEGDKVTRALANALEEKSEQLVETKVEEPVAEVKEPVKEVKKEIGSGLPDF